MKPPFAHQTWFAHDDFAGSWSLITQTSTLVLLAAAVLATLTVRHLPRRLEGVDVPVLARLVAWLPLFARLHLGVSLLGMLSIGAYLSPAMQLHASVTGVLLGTVVAAVAVALLCGWHTREAALALIAAGPLGMLEFGVLPVLQRMDILGLTLFVLLVGRGADLVRAVWALRVGVGVALIVVAFAEKLASPEFAVAFIADHPELNVAGLLGLGWSELDFIRVVGCIEVLFGLMLISGAAPQLVVLSVGVPFNLTLLFFGSTELFGHLPVYGALLVLLVLGSDPQLRPLVRAKWPWGRLDAHAVDAKSQIA